MRDRQDGMRTEEGAARFTEGNLGSWVGEMGTGQQVRSAGLYEGATESKVTGSTRGPAGGKSSLLPQHTRSHAPTSTTQPASQSV